MIARGISRPPRGRPAKVTKPSPVPRRASRHSSVTADHIDQLARDVKGEHHVEVVDQDEEDDNGEGEETGNEEEIIQHHNQQGQFILGTAANLLANGTIGDPGIHPDLQGLVPQQPQFAMEAPMEPVGVVRTAEELAKESGYVELVIDSALAKRLAGNSGQRLAVQRRQDQTLNLKRRSNVEALLAHTSGQEAASPCKSCHKGYGPWNGCVVVSGQMCGSCANCWFNASGSRCSFHETNNPQHVPAVQVAPAAAGAAGAAALGGMPGLPPGYLPPPPPGFMAAGLSVDQFVKGVYERALSEARSDDPNVRFQFRIDIAARQLALATVEYSEYLSSQQQDHEHEEAQRQHEARGAAPEASMDEGDDGA